MKIAIVGAGISGLVAAHGLRDEHDVTVLEANDYAGGHTNTIPVEIDGERHDVDTGFIVFNPKHYPRFTALLDRLGVASDETTMSFGVRCDRTGVEWNGSSLGTLLARKRNLLRPGFWRMVRDIFRFHHEAPALLESDDETTTVDEFLTRGRYGRGFAEHYLLPLGSALWSSPPDTFRQFPVRFVVEFMSNHDMLQARGRPVWRVIHGGSFRYVEALTQGWRDRILLGTPVQSVARRPDGVLVTREDGVAQTYDHVVLACHADQARAMIVDPRPMERDLLDAFPYQQNVAVLHTDTSVMPRSRRAWGSWNYRVGPDATDRSTVTYDMNALQGIRSRHRFLVTLNDEAAIDPEKVLRRVVYHHPVFTAGRTLAQSRRAEMLDVDGVSYCGAYWGYGFHEDGTRSAVEVVEALARRSPA